METAGNFGLIESYHAIVDFAIKHNIRSYDDFKKKAGEERFSGLKKVCSSLQDALKIQGDWKIYPFGVHDLIAKGRVAVDERQVYVDGPGLPQYGYRLGDITK